MGMVGTMLGTAAMGALANKKGQKQSTESNPYSAFPEIPGLVRENVLPRAETELNKAYPTLPKQRAADPSKDPFASLGMWGLQQAKDSDLLNSAMNPSAIEPSSAQPSQATAIDTLRQELLGLSAAQKRGGTSISDAKLPGAGYYSSPTFIQDQMQNNGLKQFYTLTPQQQAEIIKAAQSGTLNSGQFQGSFNPF